MYGVCARGVSEGGQQVGVDCALLDKGSTTLQTNGGCLKLLDL